jgi:hypothetical protein
MQWKAAYRVYRKMLRQPGLVQTSAIATAFKLQHDSQSTGKLAWVAEQRSGLFSLTTAQDSMLNVYNGAVETTSAQLLDLDEQMQAGDSINQTTYGSVLTQRASAQTQMEQYWTSLKQSRQQQIQNLLQYNAAITTNLTIDANHKLVNNIVLSLLAADTLAAGDLTTLEAIAAQCPQEGGDAVYEARAMVSYFTGVQFDNSACIGVEERENIMANAAFDAPIAIFPNPASNMIIIQGAPEDALVNITDYLGRVVHSGKLQSTQIELASFQSGVYTLQVFSNENTLLATRKLVIAQ